MNVAVVTGAGSGVGQAIALKFAAEGWNVALVGRRAEPLAETTTMAGADALPRLAPFRCDVSDAGDVAAMGEAVLARFGQVDVLVNSAGINVPRRSFDDAVARRLARGPRDQPARRLLLRPRVPAGDAGAPVGDDHQHQFRRRQDGPRSRRRRLRVVEVRAARPDAADQRRRAVARHPRLLDCPRDVNTPLLDKRPQPPPPEQRAQMLQPDDLAACAWLVATLPSRAIVDEISMSTR